MQFRPADIAKECKVSVGTVRNWCTDYAGFLSTGANPVDGDRKLSETDLEVCKYIAGLRQEGMSKPQIVLRLRETSFGTIETGKPTDKPVEAMQSQQTSLQSAQEAPQASTALVMALHDTIDALQRRVGVLEQRREPSYVTGIGIGFIAALLFVLVIVGLAVLYGGFR